MIMLGSQKSCGSSSPSPSPSPCPSPTLLRSSPAPPSLSVHDLLDHTWHYECVVSPTYSSTNPTSPAPITINTITSEYVSLSSFLPPTTSTTTSSSATITATITASTGHHTTPSTTSSSSNCRDGDRMRKDKMHPTYASSSSSSSRATFISPFLALDY